MSKGRESIVMLATLAKLMPMKDIAEKTIEALQKFVEGGCKDEDIPSLELGLLMTKLTQDDEKSLADTLLETEGRMAKMDKVFGDEDDAFPFNKEDLISHKMVKEKPTDEELLEMRKEALAEARRQNPGIDIQLDDIQVVVSGGPSEDNSDDLGMLLMGKGGDA